MYKDIEKIQNLSKKGMTISQISNVIKINRNTLRSFCYRHKIKCVSGKTGRKEGSYDKKPRIRKCYRRLGTKKGGAELEYIESIRRRDNDDLSKQINDYDLHLNQSADINQFLDSVLIEARRDITEEDIKKYDYNMSI